MLPQIPAITPLIIVLFMSAPWYLQNGFSAIAFLLALLEVLSYEQEWRGPQ
jgi:hypothetical protein